MDDQLKKKIAEDIQKAGFAAELAALGQLMARGWFAYAGYRYQDRDEDKERDVDINAFFEIEQTAAPNPPLFQVRLLADVKKSEKPWVVLRKPNSLEDVGYEIGRSVLGAAKQS